MIEIRHIDGSVLYTAQSATDVRSAVVEAVKAGAYLARAYLDGANLAGAATGTLLGYGWALYRGEFRYGCEVHRIEEWTPEFIAARCAEHVTGNPKYVAALTGLVAWLRTLDAEKGGTK